MFSPFLFLLLKQHLNAYLSIKARNRDDVNSLKSFVREIWIDLYNDSIYSFSKCAFILNFYPGIFHIVMRLFKELTLFVISKVSSSKTQQRIAVNGMLQLGLKSSIELLYFVNAIYYLEIKATRQNKSQKTFSILFLHFIFDSHSPLSLPRQATMIVFTFDTRRVPPPLSLFPSPSLISSQLKLSCICPDHWIPLSLIPLHSETNSVVQNHSTFFFANDSEMKILGCSEILLETSLIYVMTLNGST